MKINTINSVKRGFENLGYQIKEKQGIDSHDYKKYQAKMHELRIYCPEATLDYDIDSTAKSDSPAYVKPYSFMLLNNGKKEKNFGNIYENLEPDLYTLKNLRILVHNLYLKERKF